MIVELLKLKEKFKKDEVPLLQHKDLYGNLFVPKE